MSMVPWTAEKAACLWPRTTQPQRPRSSGSVVEVLIFCHVAHRTHESKHAGVSVVAAGCTATGPEEA